MVKQIFIFSIILLLIALVVLYLNQRKFIYFPAKENPLPKTFQAQDMQVITLHTSDNLALTAWYKKAAPNQPTLLYLHGTGGHRGNRMLLGRSFLDAGLGLLLIDYRGYGGNPGSPSEQGLYTDAEAAFHFLLQQGIAANDIILYGESLGSGVATWLAIQHSIGAVILQSAYTSMKDLSRYYYPFVKIAPWDAFDSINRIHLINAPILILHGNHDTVVPYSQGLALFEKATEPKKMVTFAFEGHNHIWNAPDFVKSVLEFINNYKRSES